MTVPPVLIEKWLPIQELGVESQRERGASSALPPLYFLHVWWARRPLTTSRAAILASLLPQWTPDFPKDLKAKFPTEESYQQWFKRTLGILGDPVAAKKILNYAKAKGVKTKGNPYGYPRAFTTNPKEDDIKVLKRLFELVWKNGDIAVCDPMSGGGSIPFEGLRYGLNVYANELNPVASVILRGTLYYPAKYGPDLAEQIDKWGKEISKRARLKLKKFFPDHEGDKVLCYLWARTVKCPTTGKTVPLSPNWWLQQSTDNGGPVAVRIICEEGTSEPRFEIVKGKKAEIVGKEGTVQRGIGRSPWTGDSISGDKIKATAQDRKMGQALYAIVIQRNGKKEFRVPDAHDLHAVSLAEKILAENIPTWSKQDLIPTEEIPEGNKTSEPRRYGMTRWNDIFAPRQILALGTYLEAFREVAKDIRSALPADEAAAVITYLAFVIDKSADYNSRMIRWHSKRNVIAGTFDRHDFSFKWSHAEMNLQFEGMGFDWAVGQISEAYREIAKLAAPYRMFSSGAVDRIAITKGNAANLPGVASGSIHTIVVDPPYYDNVMYAECSDFYYVWMKRTLGDVYPEWFSDELTNKDDESVANVARFATVGGKKKSALADKDYELKMAACFKEMYRILRPDGVLTVMFTHKRVDAWDALATALITAGFAVKSSWPIHTESEHSLHQAKKNAAASTIMLVCRKRENGKNAEPVWWDEIKGKVRRVAREKAEEFEKQGIRGVDLYISTFGPVLSVISEHWPVLMSEIDEKTRQPLTLRPEIALEIAREEVISLRKQGLLMGRTVQFDPITDWYLMAWDSFKAEQFPADEARKLAIALGLNLEQDLVTSKRIVTKKQDYIVILEPAARRRKGVVDPEVKSFACSLDAVHTAMLVYEEDGDRACKQFLQKSGLMMDGTFKACLQSLINSIPRNKEKGKFVRPEAETLENMRLAFFDDLSAPTEEEPPIPRDFQPLLAGVAEEPEAEESDEEDDEG